MGACRSRCGNHIYSTRWHRYGPRGVQRRRLAGLGCRNEIREKRAAWLEPSPGWVTFRQFRRDLVARRHEILQGFPGGRVGGLVGEFPSAIEESGGRGGREAVVFLAGLNVGQPGEIAKLGNGNGQYRGNWALLKRAAVGG